MIGHGKNNSVNPYNPFLNMWMCTVRKTRDGSDFYPEERVSRQDALRMWTSGAAWMQFSEKEIGSLERGKLADFVVVDGDFLKASADSLRAMEPAMTVVGGRVVYEKK